MKITDGIKLGFGLAIGKTLYYIAFAAGEAVLSQVASNDDKFVEWCETNAPKTYANLMKFKGEKHTD